MCCVSLPGPLQPLSLPSPPPAPDPSSSSPSPSSSSSVELPPPLVPLPTLSEIAQLEHPKPLLSLTHPHLQRNHVAELLLFRGRRKFGLQQQQKHQQHTKQTSSHHREHGRHHRHRHRYPHGLLNPNLLQQGEKQPGSKSDDAPKSWELLKSGEVSNLIKQGFMERTQRRLSPGRVSPLLPEAITSSAEKTMSPLYTCIRKLDPGHDARLLCASSPPPDKPTKSNTLFDMMSRDAELRSKTKSLVSAAAIVASDSSLPALERSRSSRGANAESSRNPLFNNADSSDVKLILKGRDGRGVCLNLHRHILVEHSKFFAARLSETWCKQQQHASPYLLEIGDCEDLEVYQETLHLLYCDDLKSKLIKYSVSRVLGILKVAALILFEACIVSCLEYLEAAPWAEEEEERVRTLLGQLQLGGFTAADVLKRLNTEEGSGSEETLVGLLQMVIKGKDNKARREMKALVSKMLRENASQNRDCINLSKESLYHACTTCLDDLLVLFLQASKTDFMNQVNEDRGTLVAQIAHQADNLQWLLEILLDRHMANDFVKMWAQQLELASVHKQIATMLRFEVSRLTARLCVAIGRGQVLCPVEVRYMLLQTWLPPLVDDFGWMQRCCKGLDKNVVEDSISQTILTLPLKQQQSILLAWFDRFSNNGDDCPNLQRAFEVWWRRTFVRPLED